MCNIKSLLNSTFEKFQTSEEVRNKQIKRWHIIKRFVYLQDPHPFKYAKPALSLLLQFVLSNTELTYDDNCSSSCNWVHPEILFCLRKSLL